MADEPTKDELYTEAQALEIEGRSSMTKDELAEAIAAAGKADSDVEQAVREFAAERDELDASNESPEEPAGEPEEAPVISQEKPIAGGLTFPTDRAQ